MSIYLCSELPLYLWLPSLSDMSLLREWLLNHAPDSTENQLARLILSKLNWGFNEQVSCVSWVAHRVQLFNVDRIPEVMLKVGLFVLSAVHENICGVCLHFPINSIQFNSISILLSKWKICFAHISLHSIMQSHNTCTFWRYTTLYVNT